jgi:hypothetical protein
LQDISISVAGGNQCGVSETTDETWVFLSLFRKGIPEPDKFVTEFSQIFLHGKAAFFKNTVSLFDNFIDQVPCGKKEIDRDFCLPGSPYKSFAEKAETIPDSVMIHKAGLIQVRCNTFGLDPEKVLKDLRVFAFTEHVVVVSIGIHFFKFCGDNSTRAENNNMIAGMVQYLGDYHPDELMARTLAVGFSDCTGHENGNIPRGYLIFFDDIPVGFLKLRKIKRGVGQEWSVTGFCLFLVFWITHFVPPYLIVSSIHE